MGVFNRENSELPKVFEEGMDKLSSLRGALKRKALAVKEAHPNSFAWLPSRTSSQPGTHRTPSASVAPVKAMSTSQPQAVDDVPKSRNPAIHSFLIQDHTASSFKIMTGAVAALSVVHLGISDPVTRIDTLHTAMHYASLVWVGAAGAIGFIEAPAKFQAPTLTRTIGLDVGRHVFSALNKVEIPAACMLAYAYAIGATAPAGPWALLPVACIATETAVLLPGLMKRAAGVIAGKPQPSSPLHGIAAILSLVKLGALAALAVVLG